MKLAAYNHEYFKKRDVLELHMAEAIKILLKDNGFSRILDVGCGTGRLVRFLNSQGFRASGCDISNQAVKFARKINKQNSIKKGSATRLPYTDESFEMITAVSLIEHLTKSQAKLFLGEAKRVLLPGGILFLVTPNYSTPLRILQAKKWFAYSDPTHLVFYSPASLSQLLKKQGFVKIQLRFKINKSLKYNPHIPPFLTKLPLSIQGFLSYLLFSTPLAIIRNGFWISGKKPVPNLL